MENLISMNMILIAKVPQSTTIKELCYAIVPMRMSLFPKNGFFYCD